MFSLCPVFILHGSEDGCVRLYEAVDVMDLESWQLAGEEQTIHAPGVTCLAWNPSMFDPPELVVGTGQVDQPMVKVSDYICAGSSEACLPAWCACLTACVAFLLGRVQVWQYNSDDRAWRPKLELAHDGGPGAVRCVDWAPKMGR